MCPAPEKCQRNQRQQGDTLDQRDRKQVIPCPAQTADMADDQQARKKNQQVIQSRKCADCRVAGPEMPGTEAGSWCSR